MIINILYSTSIYERHIEWCGNVLDEMYPPVTYTEGIPDRNTLRIHSVYVQGVIMLAAGDLPTICTFRSSENHRQESRTKNKTEQDIKSTQF